MNICIKSLFLGISLLISLSLQAIPQAPTTIAIQDWQGYSMSAAQIGICSYLGIQIPEALGNLLSKVPTKGWNGTFATPLAWMLQKGSSLDKAYTGTAAGVTGAFLAYLFWYQITKSKQTKRAKKFFGNYLDHEIANRSINDRRMLAAALARESSCRNKALDDQAIVQALIEISSRIHIGLDMVEAALRVDPKNKELLALRAQALVALSTIAYNQTLISIEHGKDYRDARRATAEERHAEAQNPLAPFLNALGTK